MKPVLSPVFKWHGLITAILWPILIIMQLHFSGYGLTLYLRDIPITGWIQAIFGGLPGNNAYNVPSNCGLPICGYPLTNTLHGAGGGLLALTISLAFATFQLGWYLFFTLLISVSIELIWEYWEVVAHVTRCVASAFPTVQVVCVEMLRIVLDQISDVICFMAVAVAVLCVLYIVDRRHPEVVLEQA